MVWSGCSREWCSLQGLSGLVDRVRLGGRVRHPEEWGHFRGGEDMSRKMLRRTIPAAVLRVGGVGIVGRHTRNGVRVWGEGLS